MLHIEYEGNFLNVYNNTTETRLWLTSNNKDALAFDILISPILKLPSTKPSIYIRNVIKKLATLPHKLSPHNTGELIIKYYSNEEIMNKIDSKWYLDQRSNLEAKEADYVKKAAFITKKLVRLDEKFNAE